MHDVAIHALVHWLTSHGGCVSKDVKITWSAADGYHLLASGGLDNAQPIVCVPKELTLSVTTIYLAQTQWSETFMTRYADKPYLITRFLLLDEFLHGQHSRWFPYIALLPQPSKHQHDMPFNTPTVFSAKQMDWLTGTTLHAAVQKRLELWRQEYDEALSFLIDQAKYSEYSWELYLWAATVLSSRCFPSRVLQDTEMRVDGPNLRPTTAGVALIPHPVLVPVLDLANHNPNAKVTWSFGANSFALYSHENLAPDQQIYNNYGPKGNEELLMGYGFTIPNNPADRLGLKFSTRNILQGDRECDIVQNEEDSGLLLVPNQPDGTSLESPEFCLSPDVFRLENQKDIPQALFDAVKLSIANDREVRKLASGRDINLGRLSFQSHCQILLALTKRRNLMNQPKSQQGSQPLDGLRRSSVQNYIGGQLRILNYHIAWLLRRIDTDRESYIITSLADILDFGPRDVTPPLRKLLHTVCGTRNSVKLQEKGVEDAIMAIFVCLNWSACSMTKTEGTDENDVDMIDEGFAKWRKWIGRIYCPPPNTTGPCVNLNCFCDSDKSPSESILKLKLGTDDQTSVNVAHRMVQRYFLFSEPEFVFRSVNLWIKPFLEWGFGIWMAEAVAVPTISNRDTPCTEVSMETLANLEYTKHLYLEQ